MVIDVTEQDFEAQVIDRSRTVPVVVDFWAAWCPPCRAIAPTLDRVAEEQAEHALVAKVDVDASQELARRYSVSSIPTLIVFKNGQPAKTIVGAYPKKRLEAELEPVLS